MEGKQDVYTVLSRGANALTWLVGIGALVTFAYLNWRDRDDLTLAYVIAGSAALLVLWESWDWRHRDHK
jgi:hypothetical protein